MPGLSSMPSRRGLVKTWRREDTRNCGDDVRKSSRSNVMPKLTVEGVGTFDVPAGKRLVLALIDEAGIDQMHACGGNAKCTTCRVKFISGEPERVTSAER